MIDNEKILMHRDKEVCSVSFDHKYHLSVINEIYDYSEMPLGYKNKEDGTYNDDFLSSWWKNNEIPTERDSVRSGLECLGIESVEELHWLGRGLSLNNHYWLKSPNERITWKEVNFWDNPFSDEIGEALFNHKRKYTDEFRNSPDATLNGLLKKRWIYRNNDYYLEKSGSGVLCQEVYNEWLISRIFSLTAVNSIIYDLSNEEGTTCICKAFTSAEYELIPHSQIFDTIKRIAYPGENELEFFYRTLDYYNVSYSRDMIDTMLAIDYITVNEDRHYNNIGLLLNLKGNLTLAPVYDNGNSLWFRSKTDQIDINDDTRPCRPFVNKSTFGYWDKQVKLIENCPVIDEKALDDVLKEFKEIASANNDFIPKRIDIICEGIKFRYNKLRSITMNRIAENNRNKI